MDVVSNQTKPYQTKPYQTKPYQTNFKSFLKQPKQVYTSPIPSYDTFLVFLGQDLSNPTYIGLVSGVILTPHPKIGLINLFLIT